MSAAKSGFVAVLGWTNVGKSTLLNRLLGQKLAAVSPRTQTTRMATSLVLTEERGQAVFIDTPGFHRPRHLLNRSMLRQAVEGLARADLALRVVAPDVREEGGELEEALGRYSGPRMLAVNKVDLLSRERLLPFLEASGRSGLYREIVPVSAATGENLDRLREVVFRLLPEGPPLFPEEDLSDRNTRFFMGEIIREKIMLRTRQEVPHATAVVVESSRWHEERGLWDIHAVIYVEKESQKRILIGTGGAMLREIGASARVALETFLQGKVFLALWVKVRRNWTKDPRFLAEIGYGQP